MALSCIVSEIKRDIGRKIVILFHTPLHSTPPLGGFGRYICHPVWCGKTRMVWLPDGEKTLMICLAVSTEYRRVTDGRTGGRTDGRTDILPQHSPRNAYASRGKIQSYSRWYIRQMAYWRCVSRLKNCRSSTYRWINVNFCMFAENYLKCDKVKYLSIM